MDAPRRRIGVAAVVAGALLAAVGLASCAGPSGPVTTRQDFAQGHRQRADYQRTTDTSPYHPAR